MGHIIVVMDGSSDAPSITRFNHPCLQASMHASYYLGLKFNVRNDPKAFLSMLNRYRAQQGGGSAESWAQKNNILYFSTLHPMEPLSAVNEW